MKQLLFIFCTCLNQLCFAQFAIIKDTDGYVNVRDSSDLGSKVVDTLHNGHLIYAFDEDGEQWIGIDYDKNGEHKMGYVHKSRFQLIGKFKVLKAQKTLPTSAFYKWDNSSLSISKIPFDRKKHELKYAKNDSLNPTGNFLSAIDGHVIYGTDGEVPNYQYGKIELKVGNKILELPMKGLYEPNFEFTSLNLDEVNNTLYLHAINSDGAGAYAVVWVVTNGQFIKQWVTIPF